MTGSNGYTEELLIAWCRSAAMIEHAAKDFIREEGRSMRLLTIELAKQQVKRGERFNERMDITVSCLCLIAMLYVGVLVLEWIAR